MSNTDALPLVSCICVTRGKPSLLQRAIGCFLAQTYANKELIIVYEDDDQPVKHLLHAMILPVGVRAVEVPAHPKSTLGQLRNLSIEHSSGEYVCQWDDDDWYHVNRLQYQWNAICNTSYQASLMNQWIVFDAVRSKAYLSNKRLWEGSILCKRALIRQKQYDPITKGEDTPIIDYLKSNNHICEIAGKANLYIYVYHGSNTWYAAHWETMFQRGTYLGPDASTEIAAILNGAYSNEEASCMIDHLL